MKCQRCCGRQEAVYRVRSDVIDMKVCAACAAEATRLRIAVEGLGGGGIIRSVISLLAMLVLVSSLIEGCGCLAANSYNQPACQKYDTHWPHNYYDED
jgi:hypothetical protein